MQDLIVLELIIATILFLAIIRPFVKGFQGIEGIAALPAIALVASIAVYPAYGLRPEFLPLLALSFIMFLGSIPRLVDVFRRLRTDDFGERSLIRLAVGFLFLGAVTVFAVMYAPKGRGAEGSGYREALVHDDIRGVALSLRCYPADAMRGDDDLIRPAILIAPPSTGSVSVVNRLSTQLSERGFLVTTFSRVGTDFPAYLPGGKRAYPSFGAYFKGVVSTIGGRRLVSAARIGSAIERERAADIAFLVKYLRSAALKGDEPYRYADMDRLIVVGFGAGGAAATIYAASADALSIAAAVAVEGPILSALIGEDPGEGRQEGAKTFSAWIVEFFTRFRPERIIGTGTVPSPIVPILFLVSDRAREPKARDDRYATVLRAFRTAKAPSVLASIDGAGPFDYSDVAQEYPVYTTMMPGLNKRPSDPDLLIQKTTALITNFVATSIPQAEGAEALRRTVLGGEFQIEAGGSWTSADVAAILRP